MRMSAVTVISVVLVVSYVCDFSYHFTKRLLNKRMGDAVKHASGCSNLLTDSIGDFGVRYVRKS